MNPSNQIENNEPDPIPNNTLPVPQTTNLAPEPPVATQPQSSTPTSTPFIPKNFSTTGPVNNAIKNDLVPTDMAQFKRQKTRRFRLVSCALVAAFTIGTVGVFLAYSQLVRDTKSEVLKKYERFEHASTEFANKARARNAALDPSPITNLPKDKDTLLTSSSKEWQKQAQTELENYKDALGSYNKRKDKDFAKAAQDYLTHSEACTAFVDSYNKDVNNVSETIRNITETLDKISNANTTNKKRDELRVLAVTVAKELRAHVPTLKQHKTENEKVGPYLTNLTQVLEAKASELDVYAISTSNFVYITSSLPKKPVNYSDALSAISLEFTSGICNSTSAQKMKHYYDDFDFESADKNFLQKLEIF